MQSDTKQSISDRFLESNKIINEDHRAPFERYKILCFVFLGNDKSNYILSNQLNYLKMSTKEKVREKSV
jgi:hypothetical protein